MRGNDVPADGALVGHPQDRARRVLARDAQHHGRQRGEQDRRRDVGDRERIVHAELVVLDVDRSRARERCRSTPRGSCARAAPASRTGRPSMSVTIQWCDGPSPSVNRPSHTAWFESACCAMAIGWRVWIGTTAVPSSIRVVTVPISVMAVIASKSAGICGTQIEAKPGLLGRFGIRDRVARPCRGTAPARGRSSGRSAPRRP